MWKFIIKFYCLFIITISLLFFSLIFFQKQGMEKNMSPMRQYHMQPYHFPQPPMQKQEPPIFIPLLLILGLSSIFILCFLHHINKSFVTPLYLIQNNLKEIKDGNLNISFKSRNENKAISETYTTLNEMIEVLKEK